MNVVPTELPEVLLIEPRVFGDQRGFFMETWSRRAFDEAGIDTGSFVQDNHSRSAKGVLRGLHYQIQQPQGKLVRCTRGAIYDVAVDMRRSSPNFGRWMGRTLSEENKHLLWIPPGFAHGFCVLSDIADFVYKCTDFYAPAHERTLLWSDPAVGIDWPLEAGRPPTVSDKDGAGSLLANADTYK